MLLLIILFKNNDRPDAFRLCRRPAGSCPARVVIYMAIAQGLVAALDVDPKSRTSSSLIFGGFLAAVAPSLFILTGSEINLMGMYSTWDVTGEPKPWTDFLVQMGPLNVLYMAFSTFMIFMIRGKDPIAG